ncbi:MAG: hypothetical protein ACYCPS_02225 [Candidatus Saccharimonadales bacterium]
MGEMQTLIKKIKKLTNDYVTLALLSLTSVYAVVIAIINFNIPLWYDEAWRADLVRRGLFGLPYAHAPIPFLYYLINRIIDLFSETNFSQRLINYIALLLLPSVVYIFCKTMFNKPFARLMIIATLLSGYIIENSTVDKPYIVDIIVVLVLVVAYKKFLEGKLKLIYFTLLSIVFSLLSFATLFILPVLALLLFYKWYKYKKEKIQDLIIWSFSWLAVEIVQLNFFVKPQLAGLLYQHWSDLFLTGSPLQITEKVLSNIGTIFGFSIGPVANALFLERSNIFWNFPQFKVFIYPIGISGVLATLFICIFIYAVYRVYKDFGPDIPIILLVIFILELITGIFSKWPFGNARSNIFSLFLLYIVFVYGWYGMISWLMKRSRYTKMLGTSLVISFTVMLFPYSPITDLLNKSTALSQPAVGMEGAALKIAKLSKPSDMVLVSNIPGPLGFQYYFNYASYVQKYVNHESRNVIYTYNPNDYMIMPNLKTNRPTVLWVVLYRYYIPSPILSDLEQLQNAGYNLSNSFISGGILVDKFGLTS